MTAAEIRAAAKEAQRAYWWNQQKNALKAMFPDLSEDSVREALIRMGWTPPNTTIQRPKGPLE